MALCCVAIGLSVWSLSIEHRVTNAQTALVDATAALARGETVVSRPRVGGETARIALVGAMHLANLAAAEHHPQRRAALLADAWSASREALEARPRSGEAALAAAYARALDKGTGDPATLALLARSYEDAPFLSDAARWRVGLAAAAWDALSDSTRTAAIEEAVWAARRSEEENDAMFALARSSPIYVPFMLRWRALREADPR